ncbi:UNVERIFIED_CONTAM: hypothetical protein PYX00_005524 [Menopon gallinae]|uniref:Integrator complex subunit 1 n=1 Tax=Menopon gallinae TaxID=328185 RepID=A0AAW2HSM9_9NEOP
MDRSKNSQSRGKSKTQHYPTDLFALGAKSTGNETNKRPLGTGSNERKREAPQQNIPILAKKAKTVVGSPTPLGRPTSSSPNTAVATSGESWEAVAIEVEPSELVNSVLDAYQNGQQDKAAALICGAIKVLKNSKWKPDSSITVALIYLAKLKPSLFSSDIVTQALSVLLKRDAQHNFKTKVNPTVAILAANLLLQGYQEQKHWPTNFIKLYIEDAMSERVWVDQVECRAFVNNIVTSFNTKAITGNINLLLPEIGPMGSITCSESPVTVAPEDDEEGAGGVQMTDIPTIPRYSKSFDSVEQIIMDIQLNRRQTPESVTRNYLKLLSSACGLVEIRYSAAPKLEMWLQNPKLMKPAQELLLSICVNCTTHSPKDIQGLMADKRDNPAFRDFEFKDRMFYAIIDLITLSCFLGVAPAVKESVNLIGRGDKREIQTLINYHTMVSKIEQEAVTWLKNCVPKIYKPNASEFVHALHKVLFMDQQDAYYKVDMWPPESERTLLLRLASESPLYQNTLIGVLIIGLSKDHPMNAPDTLELADQLVKRSASLSTEGLEMLQADKIEIFDMVFNVTAYHHPDNITLPHGYCPPRLAISNLYWKAWIMLLLLSVHNPASLGKAAWEKYPTLRMFMEMCITNHFSYPPPTMNVSENAEETKNQEIRMTARERESILEFESHLAAASTKATITEQTSLLLSQLITMDPTGPARKPPVGVLEQLAALNATHRMGHLLCRSRHPDFLLDLIQRQGTSQSMPWLADLVESSEGSLSHLPVQCLCEFLLSSGPPDKQSKSQQLISHLQHVLTDPNQDPTAPCEVLEYLLRRLSSPHMNSRAQAIKGLKLVLSSVNAAKDSMDVDGQVEDSRWLLGQLPLLPHFDAVRPQLVLALRQACQVENDPMCISSYIAFLALHTADDDLPSLGLLVQDMAQLIVERSTIMAAIMPNGQPDDHRANTLRSLIVIFCTYLQKAREPRRENYTWSESQDQILVTWQTGQESSLHILVVHAMIILLSYGPVNEHGLFTLLLETWFPENGQLPKAYLVDTSEEALLIPDWLKLRMIRSGVDRLVDAALMDLDVPQLVLFIQSFGIPVSSMSKLLETLDRTDASLVASAVFDKAYMAQLVQVQRRRGATGGHTFVQALQLAEQQPPEPAGFRGCVTKLPLHVPQSSGSSISVEGFNVDAAVNLLKQFFSTSETPATRRTAFKKLQMMLLVEAKENDDKIKAFSEITNVLTNLAETPEGLDSMINILKQDITTANLLIRLLWKVGEKTNEDLKLLFINYCKKIQFNLDEKEPSPLSSLLSEVLTQEKAERKEQKSEVKAEKLTEILLGSNHQKSLCIGQLIDSLVSAEPELISPPSEQQMIKLLFGNTLKDHAFKDGSDAETCRPYLLTLLTHRASWGRLQHCVNHLLSRFEKDYSATAVLDFLEALTRNPRLWQGREKHIPKHHTPESVLHLTENQVLCMIEYIIEEADEICEVGRVQDIPNNEAEIETRPAFMDTLESRLPILLESFQDRFLPEVVRQLASSTSQLSQSRTEVCKHLLVLLYFHIPGVIKYLFGTEQELLLKDTSILGWTSSAIDKISHTLLTAMTATSVASKEWWKKSLDFELAARKMAVVHPSLVLRQLPMIAASLQGRVHFDYVVLRARNHIGVFAQVLGIIELLQPKVFSKQYAVSLHKTLDTFLTLFKLHGHMKDIVPMLYRFIKFLQNYVVNDAARAMKYLQANSVTLAAILKVHPNLTSLRSLLSGILTPKDDNGEDTEPVQASGVVTPSFEILTAPPPSILNSLARSQGEDILSALQELDHISMRNPAVLEVLTEQLSSLILSPYSNIRSLSHTLLTRLMKFNPQSKALTGYLRSLESNQGEIVLTALERLPEMVVSVQEHAGLLLDKVFALGIRSSFSTSSHISKAIALLNLQSGC